MIETIQKTQHTLSVEGEELSYKLLRSKKRKYSLSMKVSRTGLLQINVPFKTHENDIQAFIKSKITWIKTNINKRQAMIPVPKVKYQDGETHRYMGIDYPLACITAGQSRVELCNDKLHVYHRKNASIKNILSKWYKSTAQEYLQKRTLQLADEFNMPKINDIKVRFMKARWGSCSNRSVITYNVHLIKATIENIDYVIIHELCHLIQPNHGALFYRLQTQLNPKWKQQKAQLNKEAHNI